MLRGKHLIVLEMVWHPYAAIDESKPRGWTGVTVREPFCIDLLGQTNARANTPEHSQHTSSGRQCVSFRPTNHTTRNAGPRCLVSHA
jgi:hypothetical protein